MYMKYWIFLSFILVIHGSDDKIVPSFVELPPTIQYYKPTNPQSLQLVCKVWPLTAKIQFATTSKRLFIPPGNSGNKMIPQNWNMGAYAGSPITFNLLDNKLGRLIKPGHLVFENVAMLDRIQETNIHCLAGTNFGTIMSRPFRIIKAVISPFGGALGGIPNQKIITTQILAGNVAPLDCILPESHPSSIVTFLHNNAPIKLSENVTIIKWTDQKRATLLIKPMSKQYEGSYTCTATNPVTRVTKKSSIITQIKMKKPTNIVSNTLIISASGKIKSQSLKAREGETITIFCVMSGHPAPKVRIKPLYVNMSAYDRMSRFKFNDKFGSLTITNIHTDDGQQYSCTDGIKHSMVTLKVIEPLSISIPPKSAVVNKLGGTVSFTCKASKSSASINWFFNGRPFNSNQDTNVISNSISPASFGIYQCVVQDTNEWVSASATLSYKTSNLITKPKSASSTAPKPTRSNNVMNFPNYIDNRGQYLPPPFAHKLNDNLAVLLIWKLKDTANVYGNVKFFTVQFKERCVTDMYPGGWSNVQIIPKPAYKMFSYITRAYLKPQCEYQFRVFCQLEMKNIVSAWSTPITSFMRMSRNKPGITEALPLSGSSVKLSWKYYDDRGSWPMTHWKVLYRQVPRPKKSTSFVKIVAQPAMSTKITNLSPETEYEFLVYGENRSTNRSTTLFSDSVRIKTLSTSKTTLSTNTPNEKSSVQKFFTVLWKSIKSQKVVYGGLLAVVAVLLLVMVLLCLLCFCRRRSRYQCKQNSAGALGNYKSHITSTNQYDVTLHHPSNEKHDDHRLLENGGSSSAGGGGPPPPPPIARNGTNSGMMHVGGSLDRRALLTNSNNHSNGGDMASRGQQQQQHPYMSPPHHQMMSPYEMQMMMQARRAGSIQALETASMVTDLASHPNSNQHHFSTLQQYPRSGGYMPPPQHQPPPQPQHQLQPNPRASQLMMDPDTQSMSASQLYLYHQQLQPGYFNQGGPVANRAVSPQLTQLMMMQQQQQQQNHGPVPPPLPPTQHFRRSASSQLETPVALVNMPNSLSAYGSAGPGGYGMHHPQQMDDRMSIQDGPARSLSPQQQYYQQQQQQQHQQQMDMYAAHQQFQQGSMSMGRHPGMAGGPMHHPVDPDYIGHYQPQHTLNSLPESGAIDQVSQPPQHQQQQQQPQTKSHHHRRKTRQRQNNASGQNNTSGSQGGLDSGMLSHHQQQQQLMQQEQDSLDRSHNQMMGSGHLDNSHHNNVSGGAIVTDLDTNNQTLIDNLPRIRDVSEYGIQAAYNNNSITTAVPTNGAVNIASVANNEIKPVPPTKSNIHNNHHGNDSNHTTLTTVANSYTQPPQQHQDYYSSATSSEQSGPNPPPKYMHHSAAMAMQPQQQKPTQNDLYNMYYQHHSDTHC